MPTSAFTRCPDFVEQLGKAVHNLSTATIKIALSNTTPTAAMAVLADIGQIATGGGYTGGAGGGKPLSGAQTWTETGGVAKLVCPDTTITATGGAINTFRYVWLYNDTAAGDPLIGYYDYSDVVDLADGESLTVDFNEGSGVFTLG